MKRPKVFTHLSKLKTDSLFTRDLSANKGPPENFAKEVLHKFITLTLIAKAGELPFLCIEMYSL